MEMEAPIAFLKRIQENCPIVLSLLDSKQVGLINQSPTEAYVSKDVNDEYLTDMRCTMDIQQRIQDAEQNLRSTLLIPRKVDKDVDVGTFKKQTEVLQMVSDILLLSMPIVCSSHFRPKIYITHVMILVLY